MKPPMKLARLPELTVSAPPKTDAPATWKEEEALRAPETFKLELIELDAVEIIPPPMVRRWLTSNVLVRTPDVL